MFGWSYLIRISTSSYGSRFLGSITWKHTWCDKHAHHVHTHTHLQSDSSVFSLTKSQLTHAIQITGSYSYTTGTHTCTLHMFLCVLFTVSHGSHMQQTTQQTSTVVCQMHARKWPQPALLTLRQQVNKVSITQHQSASAASQIQRCATVEVQKYWHCYCYYHWQQNAFCEKTWLNIKKLSSSIHIKDLYEAHDNSSNAILWAMPNQCSEPQPLWCSTWVHCGAVRECTAVQ